MSVIRDNSSIILGLTGHLGSGCSALANFLAFKFTDKIKEEISKYNSALIEHFYNELQRLHSNRESSNRHEQIEEISKQLKAALEKREIINAIKRNKFELNKNFFYISFSDMIIYFVIKKIRNRRTNEYREYKIKEILESSLKEKGFSLEEAFELIKNFDAITRKIIYTPETVMKNLNGDSGIDIGKIGRIKELFSSFYFIKNNIIQECGRIILQDWGDNIRKTGNPFLTTKKSDFRKARFLAREIDKYIALLRSSGENFFVVECFRNPQELYYFRERHSYFYLFALDADRDLRKNRANIPNFDEIEEREEGEENEAKEVYKLNIPRCMDLADVVIKNRSKFEDLFWKMLRYFVLILEPGCLKPNQDETLMHMAYTVSARSNCVSRQAGAVVTNKDGYVIGVGWNDVGEGQISCGLKTAQDYKNIAYLSGDKLDVADLQDSDYICFKDRFKVNNGGAKRKDKLMYCLALHAEENAILQLARYQSDKPLGGTIYSTTYPCPLCLKKISQVGMSKIIYTETYSNPISTKILEETTKDIEAESYEGVKYYSYFKLFKPYYDRKEQQEILK